MSNYGVMLNGQLIVHATRHEGDKPVLLTSPPVIKDDQLAIYHYEDIGDAISQVWSVIPNPYPPGLEPDAAIEDYEAALNRLGVNTNDQS